MCWVLRCSRWPKKSGAGTGFLRWPRRIASRHPGLRQAVLSRVLGWRSFAESCKIPEQALEPMMLPHWRRDDV